MGYLCWHTAGETRDAAAEVSSAEQRQADQQAASAAGSAFLATMFTVDSTSMAKWDSAVLSATTDGMHAQLGQWRAVLEKLVGAHTEMTSKVLDVGVLTQSDTAMTLLAVIESTGRSDPSATPTTNQSAAIVDLTKVGDRWKVERYGPAGGADQPAPNPVAPQPPPPPPR
ncbi:hypothetical protein AB0M22_13950 [Nocardia sp. NPDC051756]|uniref:hypothetical protein n=1 Tax=Nocardia sp. NPDC051756 TaxID=3154751 RepID=UPI003445BE7C